jgi:hypothetical protein
MRTLSETEIGETVAYQSETLVHHQDVGILLNRKPFRLVRLRRIKLCTQETATKGAPIRGVSERASGCTCDERCGGRVECDAEWFVLLWTDRQQATET